MKKFARFLAPPLAGLTISLSGVASAVFPTVYLKPVVLKQIHSPTTITHAPDGSGRVFVCDQPGKIYIIQGGMMLPTPFLDISATASQVSDRKVVSVGTGYNERGLLGLAFHPGFANQLSPGYGKFYVNYNKNYVSGSPDFDPAPPQTGDPTNCTTVIAEFQVSATNPNLADSGSERRILRFTQPQNNHNGGQLEFGPDGYLYIGAGDGGSANDNNAGHTGGSSLQPTNCLGNGQDKTRFLGKILRIDPLDPDGAGPLMYGIPADNPFVGAGGGVKEEIYAYGMRNPWRFSFDKRPGGTNRCFCGDVGQGRIEEIDLIEKGGNYGWRYLEGHEFPSFSSGAGSNPMPDPLQGPYKAPIAEYAHPGVTTAAPVLPQLGLSVTGGFVYRGAAIPALQGKYVFGDYGSTSGASDGRMMGLEETAPLSGVFTLTQAIPLVHSASSPNVAANNNSNPIIGQRILCLGEDEAGEIYVGLKSNSGVLALDSGLPAGGIYKIVPLTSGSTTLTANKDNTIFSEPNTIPYQGISGYASDALGYIYAGQTGTNHGPYLRRGLISFDLSAMPAGAVIQSAQLTLRMTKLGPSSFGSPISVHRLSETWGEGTSQNAADVGYGAQATTGDATWVRRFFDTQSWTTAGGTYNSTASASATVGYPNTTFTTSAQLVSDVQGWLTTPASNAGWIVRGDESNEETVAQISSVQKGGSPPSLLVGYNVAPPPTHFESWLATYFPGNVTGQWVDPNGDIDGDGIKNQIEYSWGLSPTSFDASGGFSSAQAPAAGGATDLTVTFRRDSAATDLTYRLQTSSNLVTWATIAQSVAGATATGQNGGVIVSDVVFSGAIRTVTAKQTLPAGSNDKKFVRLQVDRQ